MGGSTGKRWSGRLLGLLLGGFLALLGLELFLRVGAGTNTFSVWQPRMERVLEPDPELLPGVRGPTRFRTNSRGLRGDELGPDRTPRILAVGGSTTECLYLDQEEAWPFLLQARLDELVEGGRAWVGNAGKSGNNSRHHVVQLTHLLPRLPELDAVLVLVGVNDLAMRLARDASYRPTWREDARERARLTHAAFAVVPTGHRVGARLHERTALWSLARTLKRRFLPGASSQDRTGEVYATWRRHRREHSALVTDLPDLSTALAEYRANLEEIADLCAAHDVQVVFAAQPCLWRPDLPDAERALLWFGGIGEFQRRPGSRYYTVTALAHGMQAYNDTLRSTCAARNLPLVDLVPALPADTTTFYDDCHFNENGAARVAAILAPFLADELRPR